MLNNIINIIFFLLLLNFLCGFLNGFIRTLKTYKQRSDYFNTALDELEKEGEIID